MGIGLNTLLAILGYGCIPLAWWAHCKNRSGWSLAAIVLCAGLLRLSASLDPFLHPWDERYHALVAKHLAQDPLTPMLYPNDPTLPAQGNWTTSHIWLHKPPVALWCMAASINVFGAIPLAVRIPSILLSMFGAGLVLWLGTEFRSRLVGIFSGLLFSINGHLIELASGRTSTDHVDAIFIVFVLAAISTGWKLASSHSWRWAMLCGVLSGIAFLTKSLPALLIVPVVCMMLHVRGAFLREARWPLAIAFLTSLLVALPWTIYVQQRFPVELAAERAGLWSHIGQGVEEHGRPWHFYWAQLPMMHGELIVLVLLWALVQWWRDRDKVLLVLLTWMLVPMVAFSFAETKMPAYTAIAAPAWCIMIATATIAWYDQGAQRRWKGWALRIGAISLIVLPLRFSLDRLRPWTTPIAPYSIPASITIPPPPTPSLSAMIIPSSLCSTRMRRLRISTPWTMTSART